MGYTTNFTGKFNINPPLSAEDNEFLTNFSYSRRVARKVDSKYGVEGELYVGKDHIFNQEQNVIDYNRPPSTQPGLWCQWIPDEDPIAVESTQERGQTQGSKLPHNFEADPAPSRSDPKSIPGLNP